jgi:uncharacterized protein
VIVVSNSSPLITLSLADQLDLLREFYKIVLIPNEVYAEVVTSGAGLPGSVEVGEAAWIETRQVPTESPDALRAACSGLGDGERSAIYLASAVGADLLLIDETRARRAARRFALTVIGSIAILERGAKLGRIHDLRGVYLRLLGGGIYLDRNLLDESLSRLGLAELKG